jgi:hypothetical protein
MTERATSSQGRLRRPTLGDWIGLIVAEGLVWLIGAVIAGYTDWSPLPWIIAGVMVLVLIRWVMKLRSPNDAQWGAGGEAGYRANYGYDNYGGGGDGIA